MPSVNISVDIAAQQQKVWDVLSAPKRYGEWLTMHDGWVAEPPAELTVGAGLRERIKMLGMVNKIEWIVDDYAAPSQLKISGTGLAGVKVALTMGVASADASSRVTIEAEFAGQMIVGPLGDAVTKDMKKNLEESLAKLAGLVVAS